MMRIAGIKIRINTRMVVRIKISTLEWEQQHWIKIIIRR